MSSYPTNLTNKEWQVIKNIVETKERKRKNPLREMIVSGTSSQMDCGTDFFLN